MATSKLSPLFTYYTHKTSIQYVGWITACNNLHHLSQTFSSRAGGEEIKREPAKLGLPRKKGGRSGIHNNVNVNRCSQDTARVRVTNLEYHLQY